MNKKSLQRGFSLVEMAIVLVVLGLLLGGVLSPLSARQEQNRREKNTGLLEKARDALIGFAIVNGRLPCPDTDLAGNPGSGLENTGCPSTSGTFARGRLPWATLGVVGEYDAWGAPHEFNYVVNGAFTNKLTRFTLNTRGTVGGIINIHNSAAGCGPFTNLVAENIPALIWSTAKIDYAILGRTDEQENTDLDSCYVYREYSKINNQEFDDQMVWLSPNVLFSRMIEAGKLP